MIDRLVAGEVTRISPDRPVPVMKAGQTHVFPGGAANVARSIGALGAHCTLVGVVGRDAAGRELAACLAAGGDVQAEFVESQDRVTTEKTRFVAEGHHLLRVDREQSEQVSGALKTELLDRIALHIDHHNILVLSDYAKGTLSDDIVRESVTLARAAGKPVIVDPKTRNLDKYGGASLIMPNSAEIFAATGIDPIDDIAAEQAGLTSLSQNTFDAILITRGARGMSLIVRDRQAVHMPSTSRDVCDVVGAGDTVAGTLAALLATGAPLESAARIANAVAGLVVGKRGTAAVTQGELVAELQRQDRGIFRSRAPVLFRVEDAVSYAHARRADGKRIGFTNGVFDILHPGHIALLQASRSTCDCLIVALNTDASVRILKGSSRPVNNQYDRAAVLAAIDAVDAVVLFEDDTPFQLIEAIRPDVLIKGTDYTIDTVVGADFVQSYGGRVALVDLIDGVSSTAIIERARRRPIE